MVARPTSARVESVRVRPCARSPQEQQKGRGVSSRRIARATTERGREAPAFGPLPYASPPNRCVDVLATAMGACSDARLAFVSLPLCVRGTFEARRLLLHPVLHFVVIGLACHAPS